MTSQSLLLRRLLLGTEPALSERAIPGLTRLVPMEVEALAALALENRCAGWASRAIKSDSQLAANTRFEPIHRAGAGESFRTLMLFTELDWLLVRLNEAEVDCVVLKGPQLAETVYPDAALRPYGDIDILIRERDLPAVSALLHDRGYVDKNEEDEAHRLHESHGIFQRIFVRQEPTPAIIEVHCDHLQIGLEPKAMDDVWERATPMRFGRGMARVLEPHDLIVQLCVHLHRHGFTRLIWFKDLDLLVRRDDIDWPRVRQLAEDEGCLESVAYTLWLLRGMLATPLPAGAVAIVDEQSRWSRALLRLAWPRQRVLRLVPQRQWRLRRAVQFTPESSLVRGSVGSFLFTGRRRDKLRVMASAVGRGRLPRQ